MVRIVLAGVLGGIAIFICGFVEHEIFKWGEPKGKLQSDAALTETLKSLNLEPELYFIPAIPKDVKNLSQEERDRWNERYKQGPSGLLLIAPTGEDMLSPRKLIFEALSNIGVALIAAWILTLLAPGTNFYTRWLVVLFIGVAAWLSIDASYSIWYRFPWTFIRDQLLCALFESGVGGLVIAAIVRPQGTSAPI